MKNIPEYVAEIYNEANEAGDMHNVDCCCNDERGCDTDVEILECCDNMKFIKRPLTQLETDTRKEVVERIEVDSKKAKHEIMATDVIENLNAFNGKKMSHKEILQMRSLGNYQALK